MCGASSGGKKKGGNEKKKRLKRNAKKASADGTLAAKENYAAENSKSKSYMVAVALGDNDANPPGFGLDEKR